MPSHIAVLCLFLLVISAHDFTMALDPWVVPDNRLHYDQVCFLTAHNAYANYNDGWHLYRQQQWSIREQLEHGVRGLMLDTHHHHGKIVFCHRSCSGIHNFMHGVTSGLMSVIKPHEHQRLRDTLSLLTGWLKAHPQEIITLFFENWTSTSKLNQTLLAHPDFCSMVLSNKVWNPDEHDGKWPTIQWMQKHNKRIVLFVEDQVGTSFSKDFLFRELWQYVIEANPFSEWYPIKENHEPKVCTERSPSARCKNKQRCLYMLDFYGTLTSVAPSQNRLLNSYETLKRVVNSCSSAKVANGKSPNFISIDFVDQGNALKLINEFNEDAKKREDRNV
jgi:hypothetical protein